MQVLSGGAKSRGRLLRPARAAGPGLGPVRAGILPAKSRPLLFATPERTRGFAVIYFAFSYPPVYKELHGQDE